MIVHSLYRRAAAAEYDAAANAEADRHQAPPLDTRWQAALDASVAEARAVRTEAGAA